MFLYNTTLSGIWQCPVHTITNWIDIFRWEFHIVRIIDKYPNLIYSFLLSTSYLTTLIVYCLLLLLILIIVVRPCVCFKLIWSVHLLLAFCLLIPILSVFLSVSLLKEKFPTSYCNNLISYLSYLLFFSYVHGLFKE